MPSNPPHTCLHSLHDVRSVRNLTCQIQGTCVAQLELPSHTPTMMLTFESLRTRVYSTQSHISVYTHVPGKIKSLRTRTHQFKSNTCVQEQTRQIQISAQSFTPYQVQSVYSKISFHENNRELTRKMLLPNDVFRTDFFLARCCKDCMQMIFHSGQISITLPHCTCICKNVSEILRVIAAANIAVVPDSVCTMSWRLLPQTRAFKRPQSIIL